MEVLKYVINVLFVLRTHDLPLKWDNEGDFSLNKGVVLDISGLTSEDSPVVSAYLNSTLGSACKLISSKI